MGLTMLNNEKIEESYVAIGRRDKAGNMEYWSDYDWDTDIECACDYSDHSPTSLIDAFLEVCDEADCKYSDLVLVKAQRLVRINEEIIVDDTRILEARRAKALAKLTPDEIDALGVGNIAVYSKIKFHNAPEEEL